MRTITGELRPHHAQQLRLSAFPLPADDDFQFPNNTDLNYIQTQTGVLVTYEHLLVAWIFKGQAGSRNNSGRCQFYDVSYPTFTYEPFGQQRITGMMLDSSSFDSLNDAVQFVEATFANGAEVAHG